MAFVTCASRASARDRDTWLAILSSNLADSVEACPKLDKDGRVSTRVLPMMRQSQQLSTSS